MILQDLAFRTRLLIDDTLRIARSCLTGGSPPPAREIELSQLEDRVLFSAAPVAAMLPEQPVPAAELDQAAGMLAESAEAGDISGCEVAEVARLQDASEDGPNSCESGYEQLATAGGAPDFGSLQDSRVLQTPEVFSAADVRHELVFVDSGVDDYRQLVDDLRTQDANRDLSVVLLDDRQDGIDQISAVLKQHTDLSAIHIVSHGSDGSVQLGGTRLSMDNLHAYAGNLAGWGWALNADADLLFYGCDLAATAEGRALVDALAALTGADVAASDDATGHTDLGGDWELEYVEGQVESPLAFSMLVRQNWHGVLAATPTAGVIDVNQTTDDQQTTTNATPKAIASAADGSFIVVWESKNQVDSWDIFARRFNADGSANGDEFLVNDLVTINDQLMPAVAMNDSGEFVVVWQGTDVDKEGIYARVFDSNGNEVKGEFLVNAAYQTAEQTDPSVAMRSDGSFLVTWTSKEQDGDREGIFGQLFNASGNAVGNQIQVNNITPKEQRYSSVATNASGEFVVSWASKDLNSGKYDIFVRRLDADGTSLGKQFRVSMTGDEDQLYSDVALADDGSYVVVWAARNQDAGSDGIFARRFQADGTPLGGEFLVNDSTPGLDEAFPSVGINAAGNFVVTWTTAGSEVYSREFDALGNPTTAGNIHVTTLAGDQFGGVVTVADNNDYIVAFSGVGADPVTHPDEVFAQRYHVPELPVVDVNGAAAGVDYTAAFVEDGGAVDIIAADSLITDSDSTQLGRLSVVITNLLDGADETLIADTFGTSLTANYFDGVLTIEGAGPANISEFNTVLRTVQYHNASQAPSTADRNIRFIASDTSLFSGPSAWTTVTVQAVNNAPVVSAPDTDTTNEDVPLTFSADGGNPVLIYDDAGENPIEVTLTGIDGTVTITHRLGDETRVNAAEEGDQRAPAVAVAADGRYVVVWHIASGADAEDVYARTYNADGTAISGDILVNSNTNEDQLNAAVAMNDNGDFVVVWEQDSGNITKKYDIYARSFDINGTDLGGNQVMVNNQQLNEQLAPSVAMDSDGNFVVAWQSKEPVGGKQIMMRPFDLYLNPLHESDIVVNATASSDQTVPQIAMKSDGQFVVAWQSKDQDGHGEGIFLRRFDVDYTPIDGGDILVNSHTDDHQKLPAVDINENGQIVVAWQSEKQDDPDNKLGVYARRFDFATGAAVGDEIAVNTETANDQQAPGVAIADDGKFVVVWQSKDQDNDDGRNGIYLQEFNADGSKHRFEEIVNTETLDEQMLPAVGLKGSSHYVVVWQSNNQDATNDDGIYAQRYVRPGGLNFTVGDGIDDVTTTFTGPADAINQALDRLVFTPAQDFNGVAGLTIDVDDLGHTGSGGAQQDSHTIDIAVNAVNDRPRITRPTSTQQVAEAQPFVFQTLDSNAIVISDVDSDPNDLEVRLTVTNGSLTIDPGTGVTITAGANDSSTVTFNGTQAQLNDALDGLIYTPNVLYLGADALSIRVDDLGNNGNGGNLVRNRSVNINVFDYNIPPVNTFPASVTTPESTTFTFTGANKIEVIDLDAAGGDDIKVRLNVTHGLLKLPGNPGISITGDWSGGAIELSLEGDKDLVNSALDGVMFQPDTNYAGLAYLQITTSDKGNSGIDGDKTDLDIVEIHVQPDVTNHAPTISGPASGTTDEETPLIFADGLAIAVNDDADGNEMRVTITAPDGTVTLSTTAGGQFQANSNTAKHQRNATVAMNPAGDYVVVWQSENQDDDGEGIFAQRYDASGFPVDSEFRVNATTHSHQRDPAVAMADDGSFVVAWVSENQDGDSKGVFAQRYDASGERLGPEFQVNSYTQHEQQAPDIAMDATGRFVVVWESRNQDGDDYGIFGQVFDNTGVKVGDEFRANFDTYKDQQAPSVAMDVDGDFVVTWQSEVPGVDKWDIRARRFDANGIAKDATDITINAVTDEQQWAPDVAMDDAGNFVVAWQSKDLDYPDGKYGIFHRQFHADGTPMTAQQFVVNTKVTHEQRASSVAMDGSGNYVITWEAQRQDDPSQGDKYGVYAQRYHADGSRHGGEFLVNTTVDKNQMDPSVAMGDQGRYVVVWESENEDGDEYGVFGQRYKDVEALTFLQGDGLDDAVMEFEGTIDDINLALDGLAFTPNVDFDSDTQGLTTLQIDVDDLGHTGGGSQTAGHSVSITVDPVNDAPTFTVPAPQTAYEEVPLVFSAANGNPIVVQDADAQADPVRVTLSSYGGTMTLGGTFGLTFTTGDGTDDELMTFTGSLANINSALDGISYTAPPGFAGEGNIQIYADDLGNNGDGGPAANGTAVLINVEQDFTNDPPEVHVPGPQWTGKDDPLRISNLDGNQVTIEDDAFGSPIRVELTVTGGTVTLSNTVGPETLVNTETADEQRWSSIAATPDGEFVVVWQSRGQESNDNEGVFGQRFNAAGRKVGAEFQVNQYTTSHQDDAMVAIAPSGEFAVAWTSDGQDGSGKGVYVRKYDALGNPLTDEIRVNSGTLGDQESPAIAMDDSGRFVVAWQGVGDGDDIYAQRFDQNGVALGDEIVVNSTTLENQINPAVAMDALGNFVIAWQAPDDNGQGIYARRFNSEGEPIKANPDALDTNEFAVNTIETNREQLLPSVAMNAGGRFVIAWQGEDANNEGIRATYYESDGTIIREDFVVNEWEDDKQQTPSVAINDSGQFVVAWLFDAGDGTREIEGRRFDATGLPTGGQFTANTTTTGNQTNPAAALTADGTPIISWTSDNQDGSKEGVYVQRIMPNGAVTFHAGTGTGDAFVDVEGSTEFINGLLNGMIFTPDGNEGLATIDIEVDDQGNTGDGGPYLDSDTLLIGVGESALLDLDADDSSGAEGADYTTHFVAGGPEIPVFDTDYVIQSGESELKSVTVTLTNLLDGVNEWLSVDTSDIEDDIEHTWDAPSGTLTIFGQDPIVEYRDVIDTIRYHNTAPSPDKTDRIIEIQFKDKGNEFSNIATTTVLIDKQPPVIHLTGELDYTEGDTASPVVLFAFVTDPDTTNFTGGKLTIDMASSGTVNDQLDVRNEGTGIGQISVVGTDIQYNFGGATGTRTIGTLSTEGPFDGLATIEINLTADSNATSVAALIENLTFENVSESPATHVRAIRMVLDDGEGGISETASGTVRVHGVGDVPTIANLAGDSQSYTADDAPTIIEQGTDAVVADLDSPDFDTGNLTVSIAAGGDPAEDVLSINNEGAGAGQIGFDGLSVTYGGTLIGTASGGSGGTDLVITYNANATLDAVTTLVRNVTYENTDAVTPTTGDRTIRFTVNDGDGDTSPGYDTSVTVSGVNTPPTVSLAGAVTSLPENTDTTGGVKMADIVITDDGEGTNDLSLTGADAGLFEIQGSELWLKDGAALDFETNPALDVTVEVDDTAVGATPDGTAALSVTITDINEEPSVSLSNLVPLLAEDTDTTGSVRVADIVITDDALGTETLSLSGADAADFVIVGSELHLRAGTSLDFETKDSYDVTVEVDDTAVPGTPDDSTAFNLTITNVNEAPQLDLDADDSGGQPASDFATAFLAGGAPTLISDADAILSDVDSPTFSSLVVTITNPLDGPLESLSADISGTGIAALYDQPTGTLTLSGADSVANYQQVLRTVQYDNGAGLPDTTPRVITFTADDGSLPSNVGTTTVAINLVNADPTITLPGGPLGYTENDPPTLIDPTATASDPDSADFDGGTLVVEFMVGGTMNDRLAIRDEGPGVGNISLSGGNVRYDFGGGPVAIGTWSGGTSAVDPLVIALNGDSNAVSVQALMRNVTYQNVSDDPATAARTVRFSLTDGDGGSDAATTTVNLTAVNDAPVVTLDPTTLAYAVDQVLLDPTLTLSDVDSATLASATIRFTLGYIPVEDTFVWTDQLGITGSFSDGGQQLDLTGVATVADYQTALRTVMYENTKLMPTLGELHFTIMVNDGTDDSNVAERIIKVIDEEPPRASEDKGVVLEGGSVIIDLAANDSDNGGLDLDSIVIWADPAHGSVVVNGDGTVTYTHDGSETINDTFTYTIKDQLALPLESAHTLVKVTITPVNDDPVITSSDSPPAAENQTSVLTVTSSDPDGGAPAYSLTGGADQAMFSIHSTSGVLTFDAAPDYETPGDADTDNVYEVQVTVVDGNGGVDVQSISVNVTDVNEGPSVSLSNLVPSLPEDTDTTGSIRVADIVITDDALGVETLSLSGADAADFVIVGSELHLKAGTALDFETKNSYDVTVRVDDATIPGSPDDSETFNLLLTDVNEPPSVALNNLVPTLPEDTDTTGSVRVADIVVTDDALGTETLSLSGADAADFVIVGNELHLKAGTALDFEAKASYDVTVEVDDAAVPGSPDDSSAFHLSITNVVEGGVPADSILLSTDQNVTASGAPGLDDWDAGDVIEFGSISTLDPVAGLTDGTFGSLFNLSSFAAGGADIESLHYVADDITVGNTTTYDLKAGDILFATRDDETLVSTNTESVTRNDLVVFRPDTPGDYSEGTFTILLEDPMGKGFHAATLVTHDTLVGDVTVSQGTFLFAHTGAGEHHIIRLYTPDRVGKGDTSGTLETLIDESSLLAGQIQGLDLVEADVTLGGHTLTAGEILVTVKDGGTFGSNAVTVTGNDVFAITVSTTDLGSPASNFTATLVLDGSDVNLNTDEEEVFGLSLTAPTDVNQAPMLAGVEALPLAYTENDAPVALTDTLTISDPDDTQLSLAFVRITGTFVAGEDYLHFVDTPSITGDWDWVAGRLTLTGADTLANYEAALRSVTYENLSEHPDAGLRTFEFAVHDGDTLSNVGTRDMNLTAVNDLPELDLDADDSGGQPGADFAATFAEGGGPVAIVDADATLADLDHTHLESLVVTITNVRDGADELLAADTSGTAITANYAGGVLTLSGSDTVAHYEQVLRSVTYDNLKVDPHPTDRVITWAAHDGTDISNTATTTLTVVPDNTLVVTTTADVVDGDTTNIDTLLADNPDGLISLREAIEATNGAAGLNTIAFAIPLGDANHLYYRDDGSAGTLSTIVTTTLDDAAIGDFDDDYPYAKQSWFRIDLDNGLPGLEITDPVIIDGYTQAGASANTLGVGQNATLKIELTSSGADGNRGLTVESGGAGSTIRGLAINGFDHSGILTEAGADGVTIQGNFIGTDITGTIDRGTGDDGVQLRSSHNLVGGSNPADRNVVSGNASRGVNTFSAGVETGNVIQNNYIGVDATGTAGLGNSTAGVQIYNDDGLQLLDNVIADNTTYGVWLRDSTAVTNTVITGNLIGTDATGTLDLGNGSHGIFIEGGAQDNKIGLPGQGNVIAHSGGDGVRLIDNTTDRNAIRYNSIYDNAGLGIDLAGGGWTANDLFPHDTDGGPNDRQNYPLLTKAETNTVNSITLSGILQTKPGVDYEIDFFYTVGQTREGQHYLGTITRTTNGSGEAAFDDIVFAPFAVPGGAYITATATAVSGAELGNTSEFSANFQAVVVNIAPTVAFGEGNKVYVENDPPLPIDSGVTVTDPDSADFDLGTLTVDFTANSTPNDRLGIRHEGTAAGQIGVSGTDVTYGGTVIGSYAGGGDGATPLVITFNASATRPAVEALARNITFENVSDDPSMSWRTVRMVLTDGDGGTSAAITKQVSVAAVADNPQIDLDADNSSGQPGADFETTFTEDAGPVAVADADATLIDVDSPNLQSLTVTITNRFDGTDESLAADTSGTGISAGYDASTGVLTLSGVDTRAHYEQVLRTISYNNTSQHPDSATRVLEIVADDGANVSNLGRTFVNITAVNDAPVLGPAGGTLSYNENSGAKKIAPAATLADVDSADFDGGTLTVQITAAGTGNDRLGIDTSGPISIVGTDIFYGGVHKGSFVGGTDGFTPLVISLNANADVAVTRALLQNITYENVSDMPSETDRTVRFVLTDGDGGTSNPKDVTIAVHGLDDTPQLDLDADNSSGLPGADYATTFTEDGGPVAVADSDATLTDPDTAHFESLTVTITNLLDGPAESLAADTSGTGITAAYDAATGVLTLTGTDTQAHYQQVLRSVTYNNTSQAPDTADRLLHVVAHDGSVDSNLGVVTVDVAAENDAPVNAVAPPQTTLEDTPLVFSTAGGNAITIHDIDAAGNPLIVTLTATNGRLTLGGTAGLTFGTGNGVGDTAMTFVGTLAEINAALEGLRFDPTPDYHGPASVQVTVDDQGSVGSGGNQTDLDTIHITVTPVNDAPLANNDAYTVTADEVLGVTGPGMLGNDFDADGDSLTAVFVSGPDHGTLTLHANGSFQYTPDDSFAGIDSFTYEAFDGTLGSGAATVTITVVAPWNPLPLPSPDDVPDDPVFPDEEAPDEEETDEEADAPDTLMPDPGAAAADEDRRSSEAAVVADDPLIIVTGLLPANERTASGPLWVTADESAGDGRAAAMVDQRDHLGRTESEESTSDRNGSDGPDEYAYFSEGSGLWDDLDQLDEDMQSELQFRSILVGSATMTSVGLTVGVVAWLARGGVILSGLLAHLPAWRMVDPLVVLDTFESDKDRKRRNAGESLESIIMAGGGDTGGQEVT